MESRHHRIAAVTLAVSLAVTTLLTAGPARADDDDAEHATVYTRVELWQVERSQWDAFVTMFEQYDQKIFERLFADGMIVEWGVDSEWLHQPDGYTHSVWYSAMSVGDLAKAGDAWQKAWKEMAGDRLAELDAQFAGMVTKHRDLLLSSDQWSRDAAFDGGFWRYQSAKVEREKDRDFHSYWEHRAKPVLEKLLASGDIVAYGLTTEEAVTDEPGWHTSWYITTNADGIDAVEAAFDADWKAMDEEGRRARRASVMGTVAPDSYRSGMTELLHFAIKAH